MQHRQKGTWKWVGVAVSQTCDCSGRHDLCSLCGYTFFKWEASACAGVKKRVCRFCHSTWDQRAIVAILPLFKDVIVLITAPCTFTSLPWTEQFFGSKTWFWGGSPCFQHTDTATSDVGSFWITLAIRKTVSCNWLSNLFERLKNYK